MSFFAKLFGSEGKIGGAEAVQMCKDGARLVDVRTDAERRLASPKKSSHIPVQQISARCGELNKKHPVIAVCAHGPRARRACNVLRKQGFDAYWLAGGVNAWQNAGGQVKQ
ncbi:rhodanese-like domain-containing protein [Corynebacterium hansenii]|uniref:Rhodanese-like domain-containing protein n=1 Tax=Corynebacterium hansenii TaxID=394964 RepID=A0ABV7ZLY6_9CORY|nr:rhodanese-like domain-containing protein [Corynebacterium hansenii]WJY99419.1 molybdopterin biosynthesis protein MoeB [Corynebacterium hansenii]